MFRREKKRGKRKHHKNFNEEYKHKRRKPQEGAVSVGKKVLERKDEPSTDEEEEQPNVFDQFLSTFSNVQKYGKMKVIDSDESDEFGESSEEINMLKNKSEENIQTCENFEVDSEDGSLQELLIETTEDSEKDDPRDPFNLHMENELSEELLKAVSSDHPCIETHQIAWNKLGQLLFQIPCVPSKDNDKLECSIESKKKLSIDGVKNYAEFGSVPQPIKNLDLPALYVKAKIQENVGTANLANLEGANEKDETLTSLQKELFSIVNNYQDLYYCERTHSNAEEIRFIYCLHAVNHVLKTKAKITRHNEELTKEDKVTEEYRDQGFVRPKVVILVPFKESALRVVKFIISILLPGKKGVTNKKRFLDEFSGETIAMPHRRPKPEDYEKTFAGNTDDTFRIGLTIRKKRLKLYTDFYSCDILVASPLGLRLIVGAEGEKEREYDFLSSVEILVVDQADVLYMQNWNHLLHIFDHLHLQPRESHGVDFSRVRLWALNGWSRYYRQTLVISSISLPVINSLFNRHCRNYAGKARTVNTVPSGAICEVFVQLPQVFHRLEAKSAKDALDKRFDFFLSKILPQFKEKIMSHVLIYVPSYFDYVRLRNHFKREDTNFVQICEYSKEGKIARARDYFCNNKAHFLLYSERCHFFRRLRVKGIRHLVFYQPPTYPHFYSEMCNLMQESNQNPRGGTESNMTVTMLYTKYDAQQLAAIVGSERAARMISSDRNVHMFVTGE